ncbi:hypothetical protein H8B02_18075 [Bradyrhizobium sp. Pear77]|uniref:hypothetical protein n=1 Tax=Bradyrhizobium TaxID=374 RepID=UPI001E5C4C4E|nr:MULTISPECIES: hypothetical protein [Bradyrhizobium]MCC8955275.1 hypothetical protein [Bradyrhizobium altum]MCC8962297.1 hypothetical protein [Bradyrhizobium oropedii]
MSEPVTIERLERALAIAAYVVVQHGPQYAPLYNRLDEELAAMRERENTVGRAKRLLETYGGPSLALAAG